MSAIEDMEIVPLSLEELGADRAGVLAEQLATLIRDVFREPPWNEDYEMPRILFGLGAEMMRRNAALYIAKGTCSGRVFGYILGQEVFRQRGDPRDLTLHEISGTPALDYLFEGRNRVFYVDGLGVAPEFRRCHIAEKLSLALIDDLRKRGFAYRLGRTDIAAKGMRALFAKLGFEELPVADGLYSSRTYWLLRL